MTLTFRFLIVIIAVIVTGSIINHNSNKPVSENSNILDSTINKVAALSAATNVAARPEESFEVNARAYGVYTAGGVKIVSSDEAKRWPIASLTKLMTAVVARDVISPTERITITYVNPEVQGFAGNFSVGEIFTAKDLEKAMMIVSSNVAADAIANHYGRERFIDTMNSYAYRLGLTNTYFDDPTGLSYKNQSTVEDLDKLVTYILKKTPDIFRTSRLKSDRIYNLKNGKGRVLTNINEYAGTAGFLGGKTGTTPEAVGNLISIFKGNSKTPDKVIILLGTEHRYEETNNILTKWNPK